METYCMIYKPDSVNTDSANKKEQAENIFGVIAIVLVVIATTLTISIAGSAK